MLLGCRLASMATVVEMLELSGVSALCAARCKSWSWWFDAHLM